MSPVKPCICHEHRCECDCDAVPVRAVKSPWWIAVIVAGLVVLLWALAAQLARAHDSSTDWIGQERRTNAAGALCCGEGDCASFTSDQVNVRPDGYHFPDGQIVPFNKAAPSMDRFYWKCIWGGETKCVFAPQKAS